MRHGLLLLTFALGLITPRLGSATDAFCICVKPTGEHHFYNLRGEIPKGCKKYLFHSSTDAALNAKNTQGKNTACKKGIKSTGKKAFSRKNEGSSATNRKAHSAKSASVSVKAPSPQGVVPESPFNAMIESVSREFDIPVALIHAVVRVESNYNPNAQSGAGAQGLMQLMPITAREMEVNNPFDPLQNLRGGTGYLRKLANHYEGDIIKTLSAYHAGYKAVDSNDGIPYEQTERYVKKVLSHYYRMRKTTNAEKQ